MRLIDADALLKSREDHEMISTHLIWNAPTIEPKQGEWIIHGESPLYIKECSACGSKFFHHAFEDLTPYCAECGARMLVAVSEEFKRFLEE